MEAVDQGVVVDEDEDLPAASPTGTGAGDQVQERVGFQLVERPRLVVGCGLFTGNGGVEGGGELHVCFGVEGDVGVAHPAVVVDPTADRAFPSHPFVVTDPVIA